jgi:carotenoid cleavage dioxygenase-like enzyme
MRAVAVQPKESTLVTDVNPLEGPNGTYKVGIDFKSWLESCTEELHVKGLRVEGSLPVWLSGSLVHAGPAKFDFGEDSFVDWVDGQAMLYRLQIDDKGVCEYRNKWLDTANHRAHREADRIAVRETCSRPTIPNMLDRLAYMTKPPCNENGNLHVSQIANGSRSISMSVGSEQMEFKLGEMKTVGKVPFDDEISKGGPLIFHAEPEVDPVTGEWFSLSIQLFPRPEEVNEGWKPEYVLYSIPPTTNPEPGSPVHRRTICRIPTDYPSPVHNISLTEKYVVFAQIPYPLNWDGMLNAEGKWLWTGKYDGNLNDYNTWQPERPTIFHVIDRETGEVKKTFETDPWFFFHTVNAYEDGDVINLDIITYREPPVGFPLEQARSGDVEDWRGGGGGEVRRFRLDLADGGELTFDRWRNNCFDEPKINSKYNTRKHRYSYGCQDDNGTLRLVKLDHDRGTVKYWEDQDTARELPWQPSFVPEPYSDKEDAGLLTCFVRDQPTGNNFCVVIDTETMKERARIHFPEGHHIPLHGHGTFLPGQYNPSE